MRGNKNKKNKCLFSKGGLIIPRKRIISETQIIEAKREIQNGKSLRAKAQELGIHPSSLSDRLKKINYQSSILKPDTKPDIIDEILFKPIVKEEIIKSKPDSLNIKPDTKPDTYIKTDTLRAIHLLLFSESTRENKNNVLHNIIDKLNKELKNNVSS